MVDNIWFDHFLNLADRGGCVDFCQAHKLIELEKTRFCSLPRS